MSQRVLRLKAQVRMKTHLLALSFLLFTSIGVAAQDIPAWFFEPEEGECVGVSAPMPGHPKLCRNMALASALFDAFVVSSCDSLQAGLSLHGSLDCILRKGYTVTRSYTNAQGEEFIAIKLQTGNPVVLSLKGLTGSMSSSRGPTAESKSQYVLNAILKEQSTEFALDVYAQNHSKTTNDWYTVGKRDCWVETLFQDSQSGESDYAKTSSEQISVQYLRHLVERYSALLRINELCKTPSDRLFLQGKINLCSSAKSSNQDVETILSTLSN